MYVYYLQYKGKKSFAFLIIFFPYISWFNDPIISMMNDRDV